MKDKIWKAIFLVAFLVSTGVYAQNESIAPSLSETSLINYLRSNYYPSTPRNYNAARDSMYQYLDVDATDSLTCVYSGLRAKADGTRTPENGSLSFNTEHSWPQSFYNNAEPMRGDIHHLFPTWSSPNQSRSNHPFGEIDDNSTTSWWYWENGGSVSSIPSSDIDLYSEYGGSVFEPREDHKGNVARAMFYFWTIYSNNNAVENDESDNQAFFNGMKEILYQWHQEDPVTAEELARSEGIESIQGNKNPFIHDTTLIRRAYFYTEPTDTVEENANVYISEVYEANGGTVKYLELYNQSDSEVNFSTGDWSLFRFSNANTSGTEIDLSGSISAKGFYVVGDDNSSSGVQTIFGEGITHQDESQINHNGNDKYALVKNASTDPDTVDWFGKDNVGNSSSFAANQVLYRVFDRLPNDGSIGQTGNSDNGDTTASGYWRAYNISSSNANGSIVGTPGYNSGIESDLNPQTRISGDAGWRLISIPENNASLSSISDDISVQGIGNGSDSNIFTYNSSGAYESPSTVNETLLNGEGLAIYFFDNNLNGSSPLPLVLDSDDDDPSSDVTVNLNTSTSENGSYFTLVGNPFQRSFDLNSITSDNPLQANVHILENGLYSPISSSTAIVAPWQGFWVESSTSNAATQLTFPISGKTTNSATNRSLSKSTTELLSSIQFDLKTSSGLDKGCRIDLIPTAEFGWDRFDATKIDPTKSDYGIMGCQVESKNQSVVSVPSDSREAFQIDLFIDAQNIDEEMELIWSSDPELLEKFDISLLDRETGEQFVINDAGNFLFNRNVKTTKQLPSIPTLSLSKANKPVNTDFVIMFNTKQVTSNESSDVPDSYSLSQNFPNPFNPTTQINYSLQNPSYVKLEVRNMLGQQVALLVNQYKSSGDHSASFNATGLSTGVYFYTLETVHFSQTRKMLLIK